MPYGKRLIGFCKRCLCAASVLTSASILCAHGQTSVLGNIKLTSNSATLDLRIGVGLLHQYVDPNDDSIVSSDEWTRTSETLRLLALAKITMKANNQTLVAQPMTVSVTSGAEVRFEAVFDFSEPSGDVYLSAPFVINLNGAPPATLAILGSKGDILVPPQYVWFDKPMRLDRKLVK